jgi:hypothetical protein
MIHENTLIQSFIYKEKQERYLNLFKTKKGRIKFRKYISHFSDLNIRYIQPISSIHSYQELINLLKLKNAPTMCYVICENSKYDAQLTILSEIAKELFNSGFAYFLSCIPDHLVYYESEDSSVRVLLQK